MFLLFLGFKNWRDVIKIIDRFIYTYFFLKKKNAPIPITNNIIRIIPIKRPLLIAVVSIGAVSTGGVDDDSHSPVVSLHLNPSAHITELHLFVIHTPLLQVPLQLLWLQDETHSPLVGSHIFPSAHTTE